MRKLAVMMMAVLVISCGRQDEVIVEAPADTVAPAPAVSTADPTALPSIDAARRIGLKDAVAKLASGEAVLVDVRGAESYQEAHAEGAIHIPEAEIVNRLAELPIGKMIITYCT